MYVITFTFANGLKNTLSNTNYSQVCKWWQLFSTDEAMKDIGIVEMVLVDPKSQPLAAKCGPMPAVA